MKYWTEQETNQLRDLWSRGISLREISDIMRKTPGSISGKADRLNLAPRRLKEFVRRGDRCSWWKGGKEVSRSRELEKRKATRRAKSQQPLTADQVREMFRAKDDATHKGRVSPKPGRICGLILGYR